MGTGHDLGPHRRLHKARLAPNAKPGKHAVIGAYCCWLPRSFPTEALGTPQNPLGSFVGSLWAREAAPRTPRPHLSVCMAIVGVRGVVASHVHVSGVWDL